MPDKTSLKTERDEAKRKYSVSKSPQSRERLRKLNASLNNLYKVDEVVALNNLRMADETGNYTTTWEIIHTLSGKNTSKNLKVKKRDRSAVSSEQQLLEKWNGSLSSLFNNDSGLTPSELPSPAEEDLPICADPPTREETEKAIAARKAKKASTSDCAISVEALQWDGDHRLDVIHAFCSEVYSTLSPPRQWITNVPIPLPKKGDLSLMTNFRGISLICIAAKVYNKILLNRIRPHVDPLLRSNQTIWE